MLLRKVHLCMLLVLIAVSLAFGEASLSKKTFPYSFINTKSIDFKENLGSSLLDSPNEIVPNFNIDPECKDPYLIPANHKCSIVYLLYTKENPNSPCMFEPEIQEINHCSFDARNEIKIIIHGWTVKLKPGNDFEQIKDKLLKTADYNVIIVNWTRYSLESYPQAYKNVYFIGEAVGKLINFLLREKGVNAENVHIIGHSLGAHIAGIAGRNVLNLARITGLDPAAPGFELNTPNRLRDSDANFVDVIHCSSGYGIYSPIGNINFYPNGGQYPPGCIIGGNYTNADAETKKSDSESDLISCRHDVCPLYFLYSIEDCDFCSRRCESYKKYKMGRCSSKRYPKLPMGLHARKIPEIPNHSKFFLYTTANPPYCVKFD